MKLIKIKDNVYVNPDKIAYIYQNQFIDGFVIYFDTFLKLNLTKSEGEYLLKQLKL